MTCDVKSLGCDLCYIVLNGFGFSYANENSATTFGILTSLGPNYSLMIAFKPSFSFNLSLSTSEGRECFDLFNITMGRTILGGSSKLKSLEI